MVFVLAALLLAGCDASGSARPTPTNGVRDVATDAEGRSVPFMTKTEPLRLVVVGDSVGLPGFGCGAGCPGFEDRYAEHLEQVTARVWGGAALVVAGSLALIAVA